MQRKIRVIVDVGCRHKKGCFEMKVCEKCGYQSEGKFCPACGAELSQCEVTAEPVVEEVVEAAEVAETAEGVETETVAEPVVEEVVAVAEPQKDKGKKKKLLVIVLAILVVLVGAVTLFGSASPENKIVDKWKMTGYLENGDYQSATFSTAVFNKDHTGTITISGDDFNFEWKYQEESDDLYLYTLELSGGGTIAAGINKPDEDSDTEALVVNISDRHTSVYQREK